MLINKLVQEHGYSLVEVMASIVILTIAIIPMVSMFDMGLKAATKGGSYDQARVLANERLEEVKALPFKNDTPQNDSVVEVYPPGEKILPASGNFRSTVTTAYQTESYAESATPTTRMKVMVAVTWNGNSYKTTGLVASGTR